ncbi:acyclic terpene utilization AtuA family protein [uncultured Endozoicomonas sp.]|uniref:acyclic terpene utilization AtuA family protein n=1 Tax=uncultured Endozoicomonas sp. TaxID=432652 RepID=UPI002630EDDC|nr:acyclic terpene utilization AtuA family protein [uncultured Endozoicomonas sp.]
MSAEFSKEKTVRIGCASAFWGDTGAAAHQLVHGGQLDYLVFDYLAEMTMSIMAGAKMKNPDAGFAPDFIATLKPLLNDIKSQGIKVCSNAGGINARGCAEALAHIIKESDLELTVAVVEGDDLSQIINSGDYKTNVVDMFSGEPFPERLASVNAYLGAPAIAEALDAGADIVITGRVVDSAVVLAPLVHEFGWSWQDYDKLAQGSLAGHVIECGTQTTGGNFTDWHLVKDGYANMGFPIIECHEDGSFVVTKPPETGGLVSCHTVSEQILYEIGNPQAYLLPDVTCDFSQTSLQQIDNNRVLVTGATGRPASDKYKVSATYIDGYRSIASFMIGGIDAAEKGQVVAESILKRVRDLLSARGFSDFSDTAIEVLGSEATYGANTTALSTREVVVKLAVSHSDRKALGLFGLEIAQAATAMAPGITGLVGGRPKASPRICLFSFLLDKTAIAPTFTLINDDDKPQSVSIHTGESVQSSPAQWIEKTLPEKLDDTSTITLPLIKLALARSGDKGDHCNIGVIARNTLFLPYMEAALTPENIAAYFSHMLSNKSEVTRYQLPNMESINILITHCLGGGGMASLRIDAQGKAVAQQLLSMPIPINKKLYEQVTGEVQ